MKERMKEKRKWECEYECSGCGSWYYSESEADTCCEHGVIEISVCSWCWSGIDICNCDVPKDMEA